MRRVLGISASCRPWGNCEIAAKRTLVAAADQGAAMEFVRLPGLKIDPCRGCFRCLSPAGACALEDDVAGLLGKASGAEALVLAAPVYFGLPPAALVALLDRLLVAAAAGAPNGGARPAVTVTVMGNFKWRGVAEPFVNLTASLLGFEVVESLVAVAEGPGEVLADAAVMERLAALGSEIGGHNTNFLGKGDSALFQERPKGRWLSEDEKGRCPLFRADWRCRVCGGDFLRVEEGAAICPVCGAAAELPSAGMKKGAVPFSGGARSAGPAGATGEEPRWGRAWLRRHVAEWIRPSIERYKPKRKQVLRDVAELKRLYALREAEAGGSRS